MARSLAVLLPRRVRRQRDRARHRRMHMRRWCVRAPRSQRCMECALQTGARTCVRACVRAAWSGPECTAHATCPIQPLVFLVGTAGAFPVSLAGRLSDISRSSHATPRTLAVALVALLQAAFYLRRPSLRGLLLVAVPQVRRGTHMHTHTNAHARACKHMTHTSRSHPLARVVAIRHRRKCF